MPFPTMQIGDLIFKVPIIQGGMGVEVSLSNLAAAVANEGGGGTIAAAGVGSDEIDFITNFEIANARSLSKHLKKAKQFAPNGIIGSNIMVALNNYPVLMETAIINNSDYIISGAGLPLDMPKYLFPGCKTKLIVVISSAKAVGTICKRWYNTYKYLPDAFVVEGPLAGGHLGFSTDQINNPSFALENIIPEVIKATELVEKTYGKKIPVIAAGGIYTGADIRKFLNLGASGVQMATRFVTTHECDASIEFKMAYINAKEGDIQIIESPVKMPGRAIMNDFLRGATEGKRKPAVCPYHCIKTCDMVNSPYCIIRALINARRGKLDRGFVFAGQNAWRAQKIISVRELISTLEKEYDEVE